MLKISRIFKLVVKLEEPQRWIHPQKCQNSFLQIWLNHRCSWIVIITSNNSSRQWIWECPIWHWKELVLSTVSNKVVIKFLKMYWARIPLIKTNWVKMLILTSTKEFIMLQENKIGEKLPKLDKLIKWNGDKIRMQLNKILYQLLATLVHLVKWATTNSTNIWNLDQDVFRKNTLRANLIQMINPTCI